METVKLIFSFLKDDPPSLGAFKVKLDVVDQPDQVKDIAADRNVRVGNLQWCLPIQAILWGCDKGCNFSPNGFSTCHIHLTCTLHPQTAEYQQSWLVGQAALLCCSYCVDSQLYGMACFTAGRSQQNQSMLDHRVIKSLTIHLTLTLNFGIPLFILCLKEESTTKLQ